MSTGVFITTTKFRVSVFPAFGAMEWEHYSLAVRPVGPDVWAVYRSSGARLSTAGTWDYWGDDGDEDDDWDDLHRFTLTDALAAAQKAAPDITVNHLTAVEALTYWKESRK